MKTLYDMLSNSIWALQLPEGELERVYAETIERRYPAHGYIARAGQVSEHWVGVIDGLVKMSVSTADGRITTLAGINSGGWFGEGSVLKRESRRYDVVALRSTRVALVPWATFMRLRERSIAFNHYLQNLMNARLCWFISLLEHDRLLDADSKVAQVLASLFNPDLYPSPEPFVDLRQHEIGLLCGTSRQRTNTALNELQRAGLVRIETRGLTVLDIDGLRAFAGSGTNDIKADRTAA